MNALEKRVLNLEETSSSILKIVKGINTTLENEFKIINGKFEAMDSKFEAIDSKFEAIDKKFDVIDSKFDAIDKKFDAMDKKFDALSKRTAAGFEIADMKIDALSRTMHLNFENTDVKIHKLESEIMSVKRFTIAGFASTGAKLDDLKVEISKINEVTGYQEIFNNISSLRIIKKPGDTKTTN